MMEKRLKSCPFFAVPLLGSAFNDRDCHYSFCLVSSSLAYRFSIDTTITFLDRYNLFPNLNSRRCPIDWWTATAYCG